MRLASFAAVIGMTLAAAATPAFASGIEIEHPWARASAGMAANGAAFMEVENEGPADKIVGATADVSEVIELHTHVMEGDIMRMRKVDAIDLPAGEAVMLKPGGLHVMLIGLKEPLKEGSTFPLTLTFENADPMTVTVPVKGPGSLGADGAMHDHGHGHDHGHDHGHKH